MDNIMNIQKAFNDNWSIDLSKEYISWSQNRLLNGLPYKCFYCLKNKYVCLEKFYEYKFLITLRQNNELFEDNYKSNVVIIDNFCFINNDVLLSDYPKLGGNNSLVSEFISYDDKFKPMHFIDCFLFGNHIKILQWVLSTCSISLFFNNDRYDMCLDSLLGSKVQGPDKTNSFILSLWKDRINFFKFIYNLLLKSDLNNIFNHDILQKIDNLYNEDINKLIIYYSLNEFDDKKLDNKKLDNQELDDKKFDDKKLDNKKLENQELDDPIYVCFICNEKYNNEDRRRATFDSNFNNSSANNKYHIYCEDCLKKIKDNKCPNCRRTGIINIIMFD